MDHMYNKSLVEVDHSYDKQFVSDSTGILLLDSDSTGLPTENLTSIAHCIDHTLLHTSTENLQIQTVQTTSTCDIRLPTLIIAITDPVSVMAEQPAVGGNYRPEAPRSPEVPVGLDDFNEIVQYKGNSRWYSRAGHFYVASRTRAASTTMRCATDRCAVQWILRDGRAGPTKGVHNHEPTPWVANRNIMFQALKRRVSEENIPLNVIYEEEAARYPDAASHLLYESVLPSMRKWRRSLQPAQPRTLQECAEALSGVWISSYFKKHVADNRTKPSQKTVDQVGATCDSNNENNEIAIKASSSTNQAGTSVTYPTNEEQHEITTEYNPVVDDSLDSKDFDSYDEIIIEEVPPDSPKEFSWQDPEATVDLAQDEDGRVPDEYNEENLSLYCSYDNKDRKPYMSNEGAEGHTCFRCDSCAVEITGYRYTCVQCNNYDLCASCEASGVHDQHYVLRVPGPRPPAEVQRVLARIRSHLSADLNPISNEDDNVTIKFEIKEENEEPFCEEASEAVWQNVEEVHKEKGYTSREVARERQDEAEMSQEEDMHDEADPLRTDDGQSDTDTAVDSDEEWVQSNKDHDAESSDHGINKNIITSDIPIRPPPATRTIPKILHTKEMLFAKAKKTLRLVTPGVVLDGSTLKKLTGLGSNVDDSRLRKRTIILKKSDYEKLLKSQLSAKRVRVSRKTAAGPSRRAVPASTGVPLVSTRVFTIKPTATDKDTNR